MLQQSSAFHRAYAASYRAAERLKVIVGAVEYSEEANEIDSAEYNICGSSQFDTLAIGQSFSATFKVKLIGVSPDGLERTTMSPSCSLDGLSEWCPLGKFTVDSIDSDDNYATINLTGYDALYYADRVKYESTLTFPASLEDVLIDVCRQCGIERNSIALPGYTVEQEPEGYTCRQMIEFIAGIWGGNARLDRRYGKLEFFKFVEQSAVSITGAQQYDDGGTLKHNCDIAVDGMQVKCGNDTWQFSSGKDEAIAQYDGSAAQDRSVLVNIYNSDTSGRYKMEITGSGDMIDAASPSAVAWRTYLPRVESVMVEDGVTGIGAYAVVGPNVGSVLTSIQMADSVKRIGNGAFQYQQALTYVRIGDGVESIGASAFMACGALTDVYFPSGLKSIGGQAFYLCSKLGKLHGVVIPDSVETIGGQAFGLCSNLAALQFGSGLKSIGSAAFSGCSALKRLDLSPASALETIGQSAFYGLRIVSAVISAKAIGQLAFSACTALSSVTLGNNVETIGSAAFSGCVSLKSLLLPSSLKTISYQAFENTGITALTIPSSVTQIDANAFDDMDSLAVIATESGNTAFSSYQGCLYSGKRFFVCPAALSATAVDMKSDTTAIIAPAFKDCQNIKAVDVPEKVTSIAGTAFASNAIEQIVIHAAEDSISGSPWGATNATVNWVGGAADE